MKYLFAVHTSLAAWICLFTFMHNAESSSSKLLQSNECNSLLERAISKGTSKIKELSNEQWSQLTQDDQLFILREAESNTNSSEIIQLIQLARTSDDLRWKPILKKWISDLQNVTQGWEIFIRIQAQKVLKKLEEFETIQIQLQEQNNNTTHQKLSSIFRELSFEELSTIRSDFKHHDQYSLDILESPIKNQCNFGSCWIYSLVAEIEQDPLLKKNNEKISEQFLILHNLIEESLNALDQPGSFVKSGGNLAKAHELIQKHGLIPVSSWEPRLRFESLPLSHRLLNFLNARITQYHIETAYSYNDQIKKDLKKNAHKDILEIIETFFGPVPENFIYQGKSFTPLEWRDSQVEKYKKKWVIIRPFSTVSLPYSLEQLASKKAPLPQFFEFNHSKIQQVSFERINQIIIHHLKEGQMIPFSIEIDDNFIDKNRGIMSISGFYSPENFKHIPKAYRRAFDPNGKFLGVRFHAMDIVGIDLDKTGKINKYKVRNSHGAEQGDRGYFHMYPDYFEEYLVSIAIEDTTSSTMTDQ